MPPIVAVIVYLGVMVWFFRRDMRERPNVTGALWLPFFWIVFSGTRFMSGWLNIFGLNVGAISVEEGSPVDALVFFILIAAGLGVLIRRRVSLAEFVRQNRWVTIYLCYCLLSIAWSDYPFVALKRWIKLFGQPVMVLVLLTEPDPMEALVQLLKRYAYVVVFISFLFIKYFPALGRGFDAWSGLPENTGINTNKNTLGCNCFILCLFFFWHFLQVWQREKGVARRKELILCAFFLVAIIWLLSMAHSSTSLGALVLASAILLFLGLKFVDPRRIGFYVVVGLVLCALGEIFLGIHNYAIHALGRNSTLTDRTIIWQILLHWDLNPIFGSGFESFWLGDRPAKVSSAFSFMINEAHNGYLETYIQLGLLGVFLTFTMLLAAFLKAQRTLLTAFDFGRFRLAYLFGFIAYNWTEAAFRTHCFPFFIFFLIAIDYPQTQTVGEEPPSDAGHAKAEMNPVIA